MPDMDGQSHFYNILFQISNKDYQGFNELVIIALLNGLRNKNISLHPFIAIDFLKNNRKIQKVQWPDSIAQGDQIRAQITTLHPLRMGRRCYTCLSPLSDADIRCSKW
jgi:hypothetical protein